MHRRSQHRRRRQVPGSHPVLAFRRTARRHDRPLAGRLYLHRSGPTVPCPPSDILPSASICENPPFVSTTGQRGRSRCAFVLLANRGPVIGEHPARYFRGSTKWRRAPVSPRPFSPVSGSKPDHSNELGEAFSGQLGSDRLCGRLGSELPHRSTHPHRPLRVVRCSGPGISPLTVRTRRDHRCLGTSRHSTPASASSTGQVERARRRGLES